MSFGSQNNQQKTSANDLNQGAKVGLDTSGKASSTGFDILNQGVGQIGQGVSQLEAPYSYYHSILTGGSGADAALAPDINRTRAAAGQVQNAEENLAPRGGGRGAILFGQPNQTNSQVQSIFNSARPQAAQGATQVAGLTGQLGGTTAGAGNTTLGTGSNYLNAGVNAGSEGYKAGTQQYQQQSAFGGSLASLAGGVAQALLLA